MTKRAALRFGSAAALCGALISHAFGTHGMASAQDKRPYLLAEPGEYTDVIDAFEEDDPFDVNVALSYTRSRHTGTIAREQAAPGDQVAGRFLPIAQSEQVTNALAVELAVGLYKDLMAYGRLPLVLSDTRQLSLQDSARCDSPSCMQTLADVNQALGAGTSDGALFDVGKSGFRSATRSGVPDVDFGVAWGVVNQFRTPYLPTWVLSTELQLGVGKTMKPCTEGTGCQTGINRGTARLELASRWSYRWRFIEPYLGLRYLLEWATGASERFAPHGDVPGYVGTAPPSVAETTLGAAFIAWEDRGRFQRLAIDVRARAAHVSAGRDYTALFDALGTSHNQQLTGRYTAASGAKVPFTGLTNVDSYARVALDLAAAIQAARYVRFRLGISLWHATSHLLTAADPCGSTAGACAGNQINTLYRPIIDLPGQRFRFGSDVGFDLFGNATGQF